MKHLKLTLLLVLSFNLFYIEALKAQKAELEYEFLYDIEFTLDSIIEVGQTPLGKRVIYPVTGGTFEGPKLKGKVLPIGADWALFFERGSAKLDVDVVLTPDTPPASDKYW